MAPNIKLELVPEVANLRHVWLFRRSIVLLILLITLVPFLMMTLRIVHSYIIVRAWFSLVRRQFPLPPHRLHTVLLPHILSSLHRYSDVLLRGVRAAQIVMGLFTYVIPQVTWARTAPWLPHRVRILLPPIHVLVLEVTLLVLQDLVTRSLGNYTWRLGGRLVAWLVRLIRFPSSRRRFHR